MPNINSYKLSLCKRCLFLQIYRNNAINAIFYIKILRAIFSNDFKVTFVEQKRCNSEAITLNHR